MKYQIIQGDNRETLKNIADNSIDAIVTDPPYGIDFLGKQWDVNTGELETYEECLRVLKPGGHILAFSAARTYHHLAMTLERAGFEIRDQIMWIYSSGFPKSQDIGKSIQRKKGVEKTKSKTFTASGGFKNNIIGGGLKENTVVEHTINEVIITDPEAKQWEGWGTALKPAHEPIALARKPIKGSIKDNVLKWGTGGLNIDATRIETTDKIQNHFNRNSGAPEFADQKKNIVEVDLTYSDKGRFPSNVIGEILQEDYQKYFYCPKVSRKERHIGFELTPPNIGGVQGCYDENGERFAVGLDARGVVTETDKLKQMGGYFLDENNNKTDKSSKNIWLPQTGAIYAHGLNDEYRKWCEANGKTPNVGNNHPTVKPVALMEYLIKLITPPGGTVLDPFNGSGSTGMAATGLGFNYIGLELDPNYVKITEQRIEAWLAKDDVEVKTTSTFKELFE